MEPKLAQGQFVHVVAAVNLSAGTGKILYVNPATVATVGTASNEYAVELQFNDAAGQLLLSHKPQVLIDSCEDSGHARMGLINEDVPYLQGMKEILLLVNGQVQSRYVAGDAVMPAAAGITLGGAQPSSPHRRALTAESAVEQSGITYTVQAKPASESAWRTISVGRSRPDIDVNVNQFPSAKKVDVRVLMTNGFEERILSEHEIVVGN
jgi:hypothetical protein